MKAWQIEQYGGPDVLQLVALPDPQPAEGEVVISVGAFGINRSELYTRQGHSGEAVTLPRVLGIECVGTVLDGGGTDLQPGQVVAAAMGKMGRKFDGGYAELTRIPRNNVYPITTNLDWPTLAALPEMYLTAWGALHETIQLPEGARLLIRGGASSVGLAVATLGRLHGCEIWATTRSAQKAAEMRAAGVDHVVIDNGSIASEVRQTTNGGVDGVVELVGLETSILDGLQCCAPHGTVAMVGFLGNQWDYRFFPWMPSTVKLSLYSTETLTSAYASPILQSIVDQVEAGALVPPIDRTFRFTDLPKAHALMESNAACGKIVVVH